MKELTQRLEFAMWEPLYNAHWLVELSTAGLADVNDKICGTLLSL